MELLSMVLYVRHVWEVVTGHAVVLYPYVLIEYNAQLSICTFPSCCYYFAFVHLAKPFALFTGVFFGDIFWGGGYQRLLLCMPLSQQPITKSSFNFLLYLYFSTLILVANLSHGKPF